MVGRCKTKHRSKHKNSVREELLNYMMKNYSKSIRLMKIVQYAFYQCHSMQTKQLSTHSCCGKLIATNIFAMEEVHERGKIKVLQGTSSYFKQR